MGKTRISGTSSHHSSGSAASLPPVSSDKVKGTKVRGRTINRKGKDHHSETVEKTEQVSKSCFKNFGSKVKSGAQHALKVIKEGLTEFFKIFCCSCLNDFEDDSDASFGGDYSEDESSDGSQGTDSTGTEGHSFYSDEELPEDTLPPAGDVADKKKADAENKKKESEGAAAPNEGKPVVEEEAKAPDAVPGEEKPVEKEEDKAPDSAPEEVKPPDAGEVKPPDAGEVKPPDAGEVKPPVEEAKAAVEESKKEYTLSEFNADKLRLQAEISKIEKDQNLNTEQKKEKIDQLKAEITRCRRRRFASARAKRAEAPTTVKAGEKKPPRPRMTREQRKELEAKRKEEAALKAFAKKRADYNSALETLAGLPQRIEEAKAKRVEGENLADPLPLRNYGNTCYMNASLQNLAIMLEGDSDLEEVLSEDLTKGEDESLAEFEQRAMQGWAPLTQARGESKQHYENRILFKWSYLLLLKAYRSGDKEILQDALRAHHNLVYTLDLHGDFAHRSKGRQQDAGMYLGMWHDALELFPLSEEKQRFAEIGEMSFEQRPRVTPQALLLLPLYAPDDPKKLVTDADQLLQNLFADEAVGADNAVEFEKDGETYLAQESTVQSRLVGEPPPTLMVQFKRFNFEMVERQVKVRKKKKPEVKKAEEKVAQEKKNAQVSEGKGKDSTKDKLRKSSDVEYKTVRTGRHYKIGKGITPFTKNRITLNFNEGDEGEEAARYKLASFLVHEGGYGGGHYIAYVRKGKKWYKCSDSSISPCKNPPFKDAYVCTFKRKGTAL